MVTADVERAHSWQLRTEDVTSNNHVPRLQVHLDSRSNNYTVDDSLENDPANASSADGKAR